MACSVMRLFTVPMVTHGTEYGKKTLSYSGAALWNSIPGDIRKAQTLRRFKIGLASSSLL